jgi:hypothetical protein
LTKWAGKEIEFVGVRGGRAFYEDVETGIQIGILLKDVDKFLVRPELEGE